ncbi:MAG: hypothetical protein NTY90_04495 [Candidatus Micrarchaeota archaeon]|nr:hypothetical protein [Candidatus Micrarchaeota archaeon]
MRFFKHGEVLAIVLPESLRKSSGAREGDEYEFLQLEPGVFLMINRDSLGGMAKAGVVAQLAKKLSPQQAGDAAAEGIAAIGPMGGGAATKEFEAGGAGKSGAEWVKGAGAVDAEKLLETKGYLVIEQEADAREASVLLERKIRDGVFFGVRGFDKKFYIVSRQFYTAFSPRIAKAIAGKPLPMAEISAGLKLSEQACTALLQVMKEKGEAIEKRRGVFELVK